MSRKNLLKFAEPAKFFALITATMLLILMGTRVNLVLRGLVPAPGDSDFWRLFAQSSRFDMMIASCVWLGFIMIYSTLSLVRRAKSQLRSRVTAGYLAVVSAFILFLEAATPSFFEEYGLRPNRLFFEYLGHPVEVAQTVIGQVGWYVVPNFLIPMLVCYLVYKYSVKKLSKVPARTWHISFLLALPFLVLAVRGRLNNKPMGTGDANITENAKTNEMIMNSPLTLGTAIYMLKFEEDSGKIYGLTMPKAEVLDVVKQASLIPANSFLSLPHSPLTHKTLTHTPRARPLNFVIILEESLGADYVGILGGLPLTPHFDRWSKKGLLFSKLYSTGTRSANGIEAILSGFLPTPGKSIIKLGLAQHDFFTIAGMLRDKGYVTSFQYGGDANFDNMQTFSLNNGFTQVIDQRHFDNPNFVGTWGVSDEDLFNRAHTWLEKNREKPVFTLIFTSSNHGPFEFPDGKIELYDKEKATVRNTVKYADYALGKFLDRASQSEYFKDTVFLVLADHNWRNYGSELVPIDRMRIPALILGPGVNPAIHDQVASQIDLVPTILPMLGFDYQSPLIGRDLRNLPPGTNGRAILQFGDHNAYIDGNDVIFTMPGSEQLQYLKSGDHLQKQELNPALAKVALAHALLPSLLYNERKYQYKMNRASNHASR